mmetsp:Transcript_53358/g.126154  ORF Transcript_53358/g.126154 Transcript_53358/m.126154 type:complete len:499 (-) Transcript_53358:1442-2938(-)
MVLAVGAHSQLIRADAGRDLLVGEAGLLGEDAHGAGERLDVVVAHVRRQHRAVLELAEEPAVDARHLMDALHRVAGVVEGVGERVDPVRRRLHQLHVPLLVGPRALGLETLPGAVDHAHGLLETLGEVTRDGHHLADGAHLGADLPLDMREFVEVPAGVLDDAVVERRLERGRGHLGNGVSDLLELDAEGELRSDGSERVAGGLGGEGRGARETRVDLDDAVVLRVLVQRVLDVALADDAQVADHLDGGSAEHVVLVVGERLRGRDDNRLAGVDAHRVEVLHVADGHAVVVGVTHDLVLGLLPALDGLLHKHLRAGGQSDLHQRLELRLVVRKARAEAAEGEGSARDEGVADDLGGLEGLLEGVAGDGGRELLSDLVELHLEHIAVLSSDDGLHRGAQHLDAVLGKGTSLPHLYAAVERGLAAEGKAHAVRTLLLEDLLDEARGDGKEVHLVCHALGGHDSGDVGVDEDGFAALLLERLDSLGAGVVKLASLTDLKSA